MLSRPSLDGMFVTDATQETTIEFYISGNSDQVVGHHLQCFDNVTGELQHEHRELSFLLRCILPSNTLINGKEYRIRVRTYNSNINSDFSNEDSNNTSAWSDYLVLKCFTKADVDVINIPIDPTGNRLIKNQTFTFEGTYTQKESVGLKSFRYILYDRDKVALQVYPEVYQLDGILKQEITGFKTDTEYFIELVTLNQYDIETRSALIDFRVDYSPPRITQILKVTNDKDNALVKIDAQIVQMLLKGEGDYVFENYATYLRNRTIKDVTSYRFKEMDTMNIYDFTKERIVQKLGQYTQNAYQVDDLKATYSITTDPKTIKDVFFINLEAPNASVWIDDKNGLNMDYYYTMNLWAESILENKEFLRIEAKNSYAKFFILDGELHCIEDYSGVKRHTKVTIERYAGNRPLHVFIQKRDLYMRLVARAV